MSDCNIVTSEQHLYQTTVQVDKTIGLPTKRTTGNIHDYLLCYCPLVGFLFEVLRITICLIVRQSHLLSPHPIHFLKCNCLSLSIHYSQVLSVIACTIFYGIILYVYLFKSHYYNWFLTLLHCCGLFVTFQWDILCFKWDK